MHTQGIIIDCEGCLFDLEQLQFEPWFITLEQLGRDLTRTEFRRKYYCHSATRQAAIAIEQFGISIDIEFLLAVYHSNLRLQIKKPLQPRRACIGFLRWCKQRGVKVALLSDMPKRFLHECLQAENLTRLFDQLICSTDISFGKPSPDPYHMAIEQLQLNRDDCTVITASGQGLCAARELGLNAHYLGPRALHGSAQKYA